MHIIRTAMLGTDAGLHRPMNVVEMSHSVSWPETTYVSTRNSSLNSAAEINSPNVTSQSLLPIRLQSLLPIPSTPSASGPHHRATHALSSGIANTFFPTKRPN